MLVTPFSYPIGRACGQPQGLALLDKPEQRQQLAIDIDDYLSHGNTINQCSPGVAKNPLTLNEYHEADVLLMVHGGRCV